MEELARIVEGKAAALRETVRGLVEAHGDEIVDNVTLRALYGGLRGVKGLVTETSALDPMEGIRFRGRSVPEVLEALLSAVPGGQPLPEGQFFLLLTGDLPSRAQVEAIRTEWRRRERLEAHALRAIDALPRDAHPMTQFAIGVLALQTRSRFARAYRDGMPRADLWRPALEDALDLLASLPLVAARIYRRCYRDDRQVEPGGAQLCWASNFARMLGFEQDEFAELLRLHLVLHSDHEGGNVSAHAVHLAGSALADPYRAFASGLNGLAGPLHGLANQEFLRWVSSLREELGGGMPSRQRIERYCWETLESGRVIPGFGHAVLRRTDPRFTALREFALRHMPDDELVRIVGVLYEVVPEILRKQGKAKNPWPNVDAHSGVLLAHYGLVEHDFYTVLFGVSRAIGTLASYVWDRALGLPIERPKSVTTAWLAERFAGGAG